MTELAAPHDMSLPGFMKHLRVLDFRHEQLFDETVRDNHERGWSESFAKLERFLQQP